MSKQALYEWCKENKPLLAYSLYDAPDVKALRVLNRATGLNIQPYAELESSCALFLDALKRNQREDEKEVTCALHLADQLSVDVARSPDRTGYIAYDAIRDDRFTRAEIDDARKAAAGSERARIIAALADLKPPHRPRTHGDWARGWKEAGALELFDKMMAALGVAECSD